MAVNTVMTLGYCDTESHVVHDQHQTEAGSVLLSSTHEPRQPQLSTETLRFQ